MRNEFGAGAPREDDAGRQTLPIRSGALVRPLDADDAGHDDRDSATPEDLVVMLFRQFLIWKGLEVKFDGTVGYIRDSTAETIEQALAREDITDQWLEDEFLLHPKVKELKITYWDTRRAKGHVVREARRQRKVAILRPLFFDRLGGGASKAASQWRRLARVFEMDSELVIAILQHFIWQVKRKALSLPVEHHLMPIVISPVQGAGKTIFVDRFVGPLCELATGPVSILDVADTRSADIFRYPALKVDDMDQVPPKAFARLKSVITADILRNRVSGSADSQPVYQRSTLIGTANEAVAILVADATGTRRFAGLSFRNGDVSKGGDPEVRQIINSADYALLWKSVDERAATPIKPFLKVLFEHQTAEAQPDVLTWLTNLDVSSDEVSAITNHGNLGSQALYELFCLQTKSRISNKLFTQLVNIYSLDPEVPIGARKRGREVNYFPLKPGW